MAVRPFFIRANIYGRKTQLQGGPQSSTGDIVTRIYQRNEGAVECPYEIYQRPIKTGKNGKAETLETQIYFQGKLIHKYTTEY